MSSIPETRTAASNPEDASFLKEHPELTYENISLIRSVYSIHVGPAFHIFSLHAAYDHVCVRRCLSCQTLLERLEARP